MKRKPSKPPLKSGNTAVYFKPDADLFLDLFISKGLNTHTYLCTIL